MAHTPGHAPTMQEAISAAVAAIQAAGGQSNAASPIGVPAGYQPPITPAMQGPVRPDLNPGGYVSAGEARAAAYTEGAQFAPGSLPVEKIDALQQRLVSAGLLTGSYRKGVWGPESQGAYRNLLEYANGLGITDDAALIRWETSGLGDAVDTRPKAPLVAEVTNPEDIQRGLESYFREHTGSGKIPKEKIAAMVAAYQGQEQAAQQQQYDLQGDGGGGTVVRPPSFETFADTEAQKANPVGYRAHTYLDKFSAIEEMLGGASGAVTA